MTQPQKIIVIGAGICGLSTAIWLRRDGHEVTLIDKDHPGAGASFGNAGLLAQWAMVPVNTPDLMKSALKYLTMRNSPLSIQWTHLPRMVPWLRQFFGHANPKGLEHMVKGLLPILTDAVAQHQALTRGTLAEKWITTSDMTYAYSSRAAFDKDRLGWEIRADAGMVPQLIEGPAVQEAEPMLAPSIQCLARLSGHGHITNPGAYMADLAQVLLAEGGFVMQAEAVDFTMADGKVSAVVTKGETLPCDHAVLTAGIWSKPLMRKLGLKVPLEAERGHHLQFVNPSQVPSTPLMMTTGKFGVNPMQGGLRCAGTVELGGISPRKSAKPLKVLRHYVREAFPDLRYDDVEEWVGFRPSTPDSLPLIGEIGKTGVHAAFGHQHIGLTAGPKSGRFVADLIAGRRPNIDMTPYDTGRFG